MASEKKSYPATLVHSASTIALRIPACPLARQATFETPWSAVMKSSRDTSVRCGVLVWRVVAIFRSAQSKGGQSSVLLQLEAWPSASRASALLFNNQLRFKNVRQLIAGLFRSSNNIAIEKKIRLLHRLIVRGRLLVVKGVFTEAIRMSNTDQNFARTAGIRSLIKKSPIWARVQSSTNL